MNAKNAKMQLVATKQGRNCKVVVTGVLTEASDYSALNLGDVDRLEFDLGGVKSINSSGIELWVRMIQAVPPHVSLVLTRCSVVIFHQLRIFPMFLDGNRVKVSSFMVEYECKQCADEFPILIETTEIKHDGLLPAKTCPKCGDQTMPSDYVPRKVDFLGS